MIKSKVKSLMGAVKAKGFGICAGKNVYIGKHCDIKGKNHIMDIAACHHEMGRERK